MTTFNTGWLTPATAYNVSSKAPVGGQLAGQQVWANTPGIIGRVQSLPTNAAVSAAMSAAGTGTSATSWLVAQQFRVTPSVKGQVALWQIPNYPLSLPASISALGFELVYGRVVGSTTQFEVKTCGLSLVSGKPGGGTGTSGFVGTDQGNATGWTTTSSQTTVGGPTNLLGLAAAFASAGFVNSQDMGFALWARVSGTGGTTLNPSVGTFQLRFYYDLPKGTEPGPPEFGYKVNAPLTRNITDTGWIVATSAIMVSANISGQNVADSLQNAIGSADGVFTSATFNNDGSFDNIFLFFDIQRPGKTVVVSGVEVIVYAKSLSGNVSAKYQFASAATRGMYPSYDFTNLGAGAAVSAERPLTTTSAALTAGSPTQTWGEGMTATRAFVSADAGQGGKVGFMFMQHAAGDHSNYAVDGARMKITYSLVGIGEQKPVAMSMNFNAQQSDYGFEALSDIVNKIVLVNSSEYGFEANSINLAAQIIPIRSTYGFETQSVSDVKNIIVQQSDYGFEATSDQLALNVIPIQSDYGYESYSTLAINSLIVTSCEYGFETSSPPIVQLNRIDSTSTNAEFGFEAASVVDQIVEVIDTPKFGFEVSNVGLVATLHPIRSTYGYEASNVGLIDIIDPVRSTYGYESTSLPLMQKYNIANINAEFGFEISSPGISKLQIANDIGSSDYAFETGSPLLRQFSRSAALDSRRIKRVRQL